MLKKIIVVVILFGSIFLFDLVLLFPAAVIILFILHSLEKDFSAYDRLDKTKGNGHSLLSGGMRRSPYRNRII